MRIFVHKICGTIHIHNIVFECANWNIHIVLTIIVDVRSIVDLRRALLPPQQLLFGLAFLHVANAVDVHVQLANAAS